MNKITRRSFVRGALGSLTGTSALTKLSLGRGRVDDPGPAQLDVGRGYGLGLASYTFREFDLDATLAAAKRLQLGRLTLKSVHLPLESSESEVKAAAQKIRAAGIDLYGCGVVYMTNAAEVDRAFVYAGAGGMKVIIGVPEHDLLDRAERRIRETGIQLAIHNHGPDDRLYPTPDSILGRIQGRDSRLGLCLDIGHCLRSGIDPAEAATACGRRLLDVHLKDVTVATKDWTAVEAGRGVVDLPRFLRILADQDFQGTASFEYEKDGKDPLPGLAESVGYVRGILAALDQERGRRAPSRGGSR